MKKTARNDVTGDWLQSKPNNEQFEKNFDLIFRSKKPSEDVSPHLHEYELNKSTGEVQKKEDIIHLNVEDYIIAVVPPMTDTTLTHDQLIAKELNRKKNEKNK